MKSNGQMTISEVEKFLGLPAKNEAFDHYLTAHGISYRPVFEETPVDRISSKHIGLSLVFDTANLYEEMYGPLHENGSMILSALQIYGESNADGFQAYPGHLPHGLSFKSTLDEATRMFGDPVVNHPAGDNHAYVWYDYQGYTIGITFLPDHQGVSWLELSKAALEPPESFDWD